MLIGGGTLFVLIIAGVMAALKGGNSPAKFAEIKEVAVKKSEIVPDRPSAQRSEVAITAEAEALAKKFVEATRVEEIVPLVRNPEVAEARIRKLHPDGRISPVGLAQFNTRGAPAIRGAVSAFFLRTRDQDEKSIAFVDGPQGLKVDWESWVGWSDLSWEEFLSSKPVVGHVFRVTLVPIEYYNFGFKDDLKWQSYRLDSPDGQNSIYGYVEKDSLLDRQVRPGDDMKPLALMLSLKFPQGATSSSQVLIERVVADGWVEEKETP